MPAVELHLTPSNILEMAHKYSFHPADQAPEYKAKNETKMPTDGRFKGFRHTNVTGDQQIATLQIVRNPDLMRDRSADYLVKPTFSTTASGTVGYFLPWDSRGAAVELTIPRFTVGGNEATNPPIFFTAVLSGCSIMFKGTAQKPTIFHCGTAGGESGQATQGDSNQFFRDMVRQIKSMGLGRSNHSTGAQVLSTDYMETRSGGGKAPKQQQDYKDMMSAHYQGKFLIQSVRMWGCCFGFRKNTDWEFYLQENATITYYDLDKILKFFISEMTKTGMSGGLDLTKLTESQLFQAQQKTYGTPDAITTQAVARPALVKQVFPKGPRNAKIISTWRTLKV